jgi:hypothetical protein
MQKHGENVIKMHETDTELQRRLLHEKKRQKNTDRGHN